ncbi:MAG: DegQ family serine endoprotease [Fibrobacteres bacterium]|nr:DegQ family serine endoprotease [Fibrobacterota bacterium]
MPSRFAAPRLATTCLTAPRFAALFIGALCLSACRPDKILPARGEHPDPGPDRPGASAPGPEDAGREDASTGEDIVFDSLPASAKPRLPPGLHDFQQIFADAAEKAIPAVVSITSEHDVPASEPGRYDDYLENGPFHYFFGSPDGSRGGGPSRDGGASKDGDPSREGGSGLRSRKETGLGSGVIISSGGYILTNNHVIEGADRVKVRLSDETEYIASVVGADKPSDLAVVKIKAKLGKLPTLPLGDSDKLRIGEWVLAVGNPYGLSHTVTTGIISAKGRKNTGINNYENFLQTDAAINPGNSGGALMNLSGELIGINTAIFSRSGGYQGIGFAIPINMAKKITRDLIRDGEVTRGWLGVSIQPLDPDAAQSLKLKARDDGQAPRGALVGGVVPGSPAELAGLKRGDVIVKVGDAEIQDASDLLNRIALLIPNQFVDVRVLREGITLDFKTRIAKRDEKRVAGAHVESDEDARHPAGLSVARLSREVKQRFGLDKALGRGVVVTAVEAGSRAATAGVHEGDVVLEVNRVAVDDAEAFAVAMAQAKKGNKILMLVNRKGNVLLLGL